MEMSAFCITAADMLMYFCAVVSVVILLVVAFVSSLFVSDDAMMHKRTGGAYDLEVRNIICCWHSVQSLASATSIAF
jgi:hypothetical protein